MHQCPYCGYRAKGSDLKSHFTKPKKKGPRCAGLRVVVPIDVWNKQILPHYMSDAKFPDLSKYVKTGRPRSSWSDASSPTKRRRTQEIEKTLAKFSNESQEFILNAIRRSSDNKVVKKNIASIIF